VQIEAGLKEKGLQSRIHRRATRNCPLSERQKSNTTRSKVRARVEYVFRPPAELDGRQDRAHHRYRAREIQDRDDELGYNIRRLVQLERMAAASA
jgi:hypothetical protein